MPAVAEAIGSSSLFDRHGPGLLEPVSLSTTSVSSPSSTVMADPRRTDVLRLSRRPRRRCPGHETVEQRPGGPGHVVDGLIEGGTIRFGRSPVAADLAHVLQGG